MKKIIALLLVFCVAFPLWACAGSCEHDFTSQIIKYSTCGEEGEKEYKCKYCSYSYVTEIPKSTFHSYETVGFKQATCLEDGEKTQKCTVCGDITTEVISVTNHMYKETVINQATCVESGKKKYTCTRCGDSYTETIELQSLTANEVYEQTKLSVGEITTYKKNGSELALGTGFVYSSDGRIMTNYHVIEDAYSAKITINDKTYTISSVLAYDKNIDLAVLKITATNLVELKTCALTHAVGKGVYAFGSSKGLTATFSQGIITYSKRTIDGVNYVQHDAAISNGNSGGPLINEYGEVIGINTMTIKDSQNLNFAIAVSEISNLKFGSSITLAKLYEQENGGGTTTTDTFTSIKNYIISKGKYDSSDKEYQLDFGFEYYDSLIYQYVAYYDTVDKEISLGLYILSGTYSNMFFLYMDAIDGSYEYAWIDDYEQFLMGNVYGSTFTQNTTSLTYTYSQNFVSSSTRTSALKVAASMLKLILIEMPPYFSSIGLTAKKLGFTNF